MNLLPSRAERRRVHTAREKETRLRQKAAAARKTLTIRDMPSLVRLVVTSRDIDPDAAIACLYQEYYYGGAGDHDFADRIFDPALSDLSRLPMGVLDQKEELLPGKYVPHSLAGLTDLTERMISGTRDKILIETLTQGWPGHGSGEQRLNDHLGKLQQIQKSHPPLYWALVTGRHRRVVLALRDGRYAGMSTAAAAALQEPDTRAAIRSALECQTLLWCAHDVQMILARNAKATSNPLGDMLLSDKTVVEPATVMNEAREMRDALTSLLNAYRIQHDAGVEHCANNPDIMESGLIRRLRRQVEGQAAVHGVNPDRLTGRLSSLMDSLDKRLQGANDAFLQQLMVPRKANLGHKSFQPMWFSGLAPLAASSVAILRYQQAEVQTKALIDELLPVRGIRPAARYGMALPAFDQRHMPKGWRQRSRDLLHEWRSSLLKDKDLHSRSPNDIFRSERTGDQPLRAALAFMDLVGNRRIGDDHGDQSDIRRTFYLLDVLPEHRLTIG